MTLNGLTIMSLSFFLNQKVFTVTSTIFGSLLFLFRFNYDLPLNLFSIPSPRATILLPKWLFILSIQSWCPTKGVQEVILFPSVTPHFPQIIVRVYVVAIIGEQKLGSRDEPHSSRSIYIKIKRISEKIFNFAKGNSRIKSMIPS